jgi:hypothetical protein
MPELDGLEALRKHIGLKEIMSLIERTAQWVSPETFRYLPVWYPEFSRRACIYKSNWSEKQLNKNGTTGDATQKYEANINASNALTLALGLKKRERPNWSCCHIWGIDDASFQKSNRVVSDPHFYSCVANMVLLPTPLKAFTDTMLEVKAMLRICSKNLYGWHCDHPDLDAAGSEITNWTAWDAYPASWPTSKCERVPIGTVPFSPTIKAYADRRLERIRKDLVSAGNYYPREQVRKVFAYWQKWMALSEPGHGGWGVE